MLRRQQHGQVRPERLRIPDARAGADDAVDGRPPARAQGLRDEGLADALHARVALRHARLRLQGGGERGPPRRHAARGRLRPPRGRAPALFLRAGRKRRRARPGHLGAPPRTPHDGGRRGVGRHERARLLGFERRQRRRVALPRLRRDRGARKARLVPGRARARLHGRRLRARRRARRQWRPAGRDARAPRGRHGPLGRLRRARVAPRGAAGGRSRDRALRRAGRRARPHALRPAGAGGAAARRDVRRGRRARAVRL